MVQWCSKFYENAHQLKTSGWSRYIYISTSLWAWIVFYRTINYCILPYNKLFHLKNLSGQNQKRWYISNGTIQSDSFYRTLMPNIGNWYWWAHKEELSATEGWCTKWEGQNFSWQTNHNWLTCQARVFGPLCCIIVCSCHCFVFYQQFCCSRLNLNARSSVQNCLNPFTTSIVFIVWYSC